MALGTSVIATDCPTGPRDLLRDGAGLLVAPGDVESLANAIELLVSDVGLRDASIRNATGKVEAYAPANANRRMLSVIEEIMTDFGGAVARRESIRSVSGDGGNEELTAR
jgi:glycosyltransferase involved in cell wall biosynthesis